MILLTDPEIASRSCEVCQKFLHEEHGFCLYPGTDKPILRPPGNNPACRVKGKTCPKGTPEALRTLNPQNQAVWQHYLKCKETGQWPDDEIVREHAGIIAEVKRRVEALKEEKRDLLMQARTGLF